MRRAQVIQIVLALAAIFVAGFLTGRFTVPAPPTLVSSAAGHFMTSEAVLNRLTGQLRLDAAQQAQFGPVLEDLAIQLARVPPASQERLDLFRQSLPKQKAILRPEQYPAFERVVEQTERRFRQAIRRRRAETNAP